MDYDEDAAPPPSSIVFIELWLGDNNSTYVKVALYLQWKFPNFLCIIPTTK